MYSILVMKIHFLEDFIENLANLFLRYYLAYSVYLVDSDIKPDDSL